MLATHLYLATRLKMNGATRTLPVYALVAADGHNIHPERSSIRQDISKPPSYNAVHDWLGPR